MNMADQELTNQQWTAVLELFAQMVDDGDPARVLAGEPDAGIRAALENLLQHHNRAEKMRFLEDQITLVSELGATGPPVFEAGQMLAGRFAILRMLGRGGMGEVYLADDQRLMETVALKTIQRELARDKSNRARFLAEVQNSRRVTHPNVCRIFDLFEHEGIAFYSMEYVAGPTLAEVLAVGAVQPERAKLLAIQAAEGLWMAHKNGILHCDLKPANIILSGSGKSERAVITDFGLARALGLTEAAVHGFSMAGTPPYMAPELRMGQPASVRTDIYAFGKVMEALLPGSKLAQLCAAEEAERRPASLELVLKELRGDTTRRQWVAGAAVAGTGFAYALYEQTRPKLRITSHQRVRVNGFTPADGKSAKAIRELLVMALRQSPLLSVVGDRQYPLPQQASIVSAGFALPIADLLATAREEKANLAIEGQLEAKDKGLALTLSVYDPNGAAPLYKTRKEVPDSRDLVHLAELAAEDLRASAFGESAPHTAYQSIEKITSSSPEAIDCYFQAVAFFEKSDAGGALQMVDRAIAIDPDFVLAHHFRARTLFSSSLLESALEEEEKAFALRGRVTEHERYWIESQYYNIIGDWAGAASALQKNTVRFPDEAVFHRQLASTLVRLGRYDEAIPSNRRSIELDPFGANNRSELLVNLAVANRTDECLEEARKMEASGRTPAMVHRDLALAWLQREEYERSLAECRLFGAGARERESGSRLITLPPLIMTGRFQEAIHLIEGDLALDASRPDEEKEQADTYIRRNMLGQLQRLNGNGALAAEQAEFLVNLRPLACNLIYLREGCALALELKDERLAERGLDKLLAIQGKWPSSHCQSAVWLTRAMLLDAKGDSRAGDLFAKAKGLWPDPINLFHVAQWEGKSGLAQAQLASLNELERLRGTVYRHHFAGLVVLGWLEQARCLRRLSRLAESLRMYDRVLRHWSGAQITGHFLQQVRREKDAI
jgi:tetratricopeptide (TPR) repeat protein